MTRSVSSTCEILSHQMSHYSKEDLKRGFLFKVVNDHQSKKANTRSSPVEESILHNSSYSSVSLRSFQITYIKVNIVEYTIKQTKKLLRNKENSWISIGCWLFFPHHQARNMSLLTEVNGQGEPANSGAIVHIVICCLQHQNVFCSTSVPFGKLISYNLLICTERALIKTLPSKFSYCRTVLSSELWKQP